MDGALVIALHIPKQRSKKVIGYLLEGGLLISEKISESAGIAYTQTLPPSGRMKRTQR